MPESCPTLTVFAGEVAAGGGDVIIPTVNTKLAMSKHVVFAIGSHF